MQKSIRCGCSTGSDLGSYRESTKINVINNFLLPCDGRIRSGELDSYAVFAGRGDVVEQDPSATDVTGSGVGASGTIRRRVRGEGVARGSLSATGTEILSFLLDEITEEPETEPKTLVVEISSVPLHLSQTWFMEILRSGMTEHRSGSGAP